MDRKRGMIWRGTILWILGLGLMASQWGCAALLGTTGELTVCFQETPTIEGCLDKIDTAARVLRIGEYALTKTKIHADSEWPNKLVSIPDPATYDEILRKIYKEGFYKKGGALEISPTKISAYYYEALLFEPRPFALELLAEVIGNRDLSKEERKEVVREVYEQLMGIQEYETKKEIAGGRGTSSEVHMNVIDAVLSLCDNADEIRAVRDQQLELVSEIAKKEGEIEELKLKLKDEETPDSDKAELKSEKKIIESDVKKLEKELDVVYDQLKVEMEKVETQTTAFTEEQKKLARACQDVMNSIMGMEAQSVALLTCALYQIYKAVPAMPNELATLAQDMGTAATNPVQAAMFALRIMKIKENAFRLPGNAKAIIVQLNNQIKLLKLFSGRFKSRLEVETTG